MIEAKNISKRFDGFTALDNISCVIPDGTEKANQRFFECSPECISRMEEM